MNWIIAVLIIVLLMPMPSQHLEIKRLPPPIEIIEEIEDPVIEQIEEKNEPKQIEDKKRKRKLLQRILRKT